MADSKEVLQEALALEAQDRLCRLAQAWKRRREGQKLKPGTIKHARAQLEFFIGAYTLFQVIHNDDKATLFSPLVLVMLSTGQDSVQLWGSAPSQ